MPSSVVSSKGQIVIPKEVRTRMHLNKGDRVEFLLEADGVVRLRPMTRDIRSLRGILKWEGPPVSLEDMDRAIEEAVAERYRRSCSE